MKLTKKDKELYKQHRKQKLLQHDIAQELESLTFEELIHLAMEINQFYTKSNGQHTIVINCPKYVQRSMKAKKKKYRIYITWSTEVEAENYNEAIIEGAEEWYVGHDHKDFTAEEIE